ncbi:hypothetical protein AB0B50_20240 [Streptomyces sp. NPDC041068]|uniref:hypothetical protein n=1 Tax=Streptomyces sp. NPDC041068 TaxID=3155130 RepID=UPI0033E9C268
MGDSPGQLFTSGGEFHGQPEPPLPFAVSLAVGPRLFALGAYLGETIRRASGATWRTSEADGGMNIALDLPDGSVIRPVQRIIKRFQNGPEGSIMAYAAGLGLPLPTQEPGHRRTWFRRRQVTRAAAACPDWQAALMPTQKPSRSAT